MLPLDAGCGVSNVEAVQDLGGLPGDGADLTEGHDAGTDWKIVEWGVIAEEYIE